MRVERTDYPQFHKCWLTSDEYDDLCRTTDSYRDELIMRLSGEVGLRSFEIPQITPEHPHREVIEDDSYHFLRVPEGKDTSGNGGKPRDAYLPRSVERDLHRYQRAESISDDEPFIDMTRRSVQRIVKTVAERTAERTDNDDFQKVSSHDLRRYFAHTCLVEKRMNPRVVMEIGGWEDYAALEPYLNKPSPGTIVAEFESAGLA
jgi:integrase